uniref:Uncharacterized protein n=1 Tax=Arundo donax TaxID=35708 RepID=A0A0A8YAH7_ARUDO
MILHGMGLAQLISRTCSGCRSCDE